MFSSKMLTFALGGAGGATLAAAFAGGRATSSSGSLHGPGPLTSTAHAHCQVPCGIYDDGGRIKSIREDVTTITKAMTQINELAGKGDAASLNQAVRWVNTKEQHATNIQRTVGDYFLTQKVKMVPKGDPHYPAYLEALAVHHAVLRGAMRAKQQTTVATAEALSHDVGHLGLLYGE